MRHATVDHMGPRHPTLHGPQAPFHLRHHASGQGWQQCGEFLGVDRGDHLGAVRPIPIQTLDIGEDHEGIGPHRFGECGSGGIGIDVQGCAVAITGHGGDHRDAIVIEQGFDEIGIDLHDVTHQADVHRAAFNGCGATFRDKQLGILPRDPHRIRAVFVDQPHEFTLHLADEHHAHHLHDLRGGLAQAADELRFHPQAVEHGGDLWAAAVHHDRAQTSAFECHDVFGEGTLQSDIDHGIAAVLHHDGGRRIARSGLHGLPILRWHRPSSRGRNRPSGRSSTWWPRYRRH